MTSLQPFLTSLLNSLPPPPAAQNVLNDLIKKTLQDTKDKTSLENRKSQWEYLLKNEIFILAVRMCSTLYIKALIPEMKSVLTSRRRVKLSKTQTRNITKSYATNSTWFSHSRNTVSSITRLSLTDL